MMAQYQPNHGIGRSAKAGCYIQILREVNPDPLTNWCLGSLAIGKAKEASLAVASYGQRLAYTVKAADIPPLAYGDHVPPTGCSI